MELTRMETLLLCIIAASGLCGVSSSTKRQYHIITDPKNWTDAVSYCREKYTGLGGVNNSADVILLSMALPQNWRLSGAPQMVFIGMYNDASTWRWSMSDKDFYKDGKDKFRSWLAGEPKISGNKQCVYTDETGMWDESPCDQTLKAVCFYITGPNVTFYFINDSMTWTEAQDYCRTHYTDLASVRNMLENQKVEELVPAGERVWIGLSRDWMLTDGNTATFKNWAINEPNMATNACVVLNFGISGKMEDRACDYPRPFACYQDPEVVPLVSKHVVKVRLVKNSSLDLNNSTVLDNMLHEFKGKLKDQGVSGDIRLSWTKQSDKEVFYTKEKTTTKEKQKKTKDSCVSP